MRILAILRMLVVVGVGLEQYSGLDVWLDYKEKSEAGMTQQQIADSLGVSRSQVAKRLQFASFPDKVLDKIVHTKSINERHSWEMTELFTVNIFSQEILLCEIIDNVLGRTKEPTSKQLWKYFHSRARVKPRRNGRGQKPDLSTLG